MFAIIVKSEKRLLINVYIKISRNLGGTLFGFLETFSSFLALYLLSNLPAFYKHN